MTSSAKSTLTALAVATAAAAVLTTASIPAQAEYQRAPHVKRKITRIPNYPRAPNGRRGQAPFARVLECKPAYVQGGFKPAVINSTGRTLGAGRKIQWRVIMAGGAVYTGTLTLYSPLPAGQGRVLMGLIHAKFLCRASLFAA